MTSRAQHLSVNLPGRLESHPSRRALACACCALQELDPEDLEHTMCDATQSDEKGLLAHTDDETCRLHLTFVHAHGAPKGELTTFTRSGALRMQNPSPDRPRSRS